MVRSIPTHIFIETILDLGCILQFRNVKYGEDNIFEHYLGINGSTVQIFVSDEFIDEPIANIYLLQLGLEEQVGLLPFR